MSRPKPKPCIDLKSFAIITNTTPPDGAILLEQLSTGAWRCKFGVTLHSDARRVAIGQALKLKGAPQSVSATVTRTRGGFGVLELTSESYELIFDVIGWYDPITSSRLHSAVIEALANDGDVEPHPDIDPFLPDNPKKTGSPG